MYLRIMELLQPRSSLRTMGFPQPRLTLRIRGYLYGRGGGYYFSQERPSPFPACLSRPQESHHNQLLPAMPSSWPWATGPPRPNPEPRVLPLWSSEAGPQVTPSSCACRELGIGLLPPQPGLRPVGGWAGPSPLHKGPRGWAGSRRAYPPASPSTPWACRWLAGCVVLSLGLFPQQKNEAGHVAYF